MAKAGKRSKSGDVKGGPAGGGKWDQALSSSAFEEETWNPCVAWVVGRQPEDSKHIEALNIIVQTGTRKLFSVITKETLYQDVRELGNPKVKKAKEIPANSEVCEACKPYLDSDEPIPVPLLAKLIKWKLMAVKTADQKRRDAEQKALKAKQLADKKKAAGKDGGKDAGKERAKSPKKGGKKTPEPQQAKDGSKLRKRGEEDSDSKFIDDEPDDGAHHYIIVTGFHDPRVFQYLEDISVHVSTVIGVGSQDYERAKKKPAGPAEGSAEPTEEAVDPQAEEMKKELKVFWTDLLPLLQRLPDTSQLHDIARLDYEVKSLVIPSDPNDAEQKVQYSTSIFEDIATMIYDLLDAKRLYKTYLQNLKLVRVPVYGQEDVVEASPVPPPTPGASYDQSVSQPAPAAPVERAPLQPVDLRYYNDLMNTIPQESVSIPLIMHCMLEQVVASEQGTDPPSEQPPPTRSDGVNFSLASYLSEVAFKLGLSQKEHQVLSEVLDLPPTPPEEPSPPELIYVQDDISNRTQHLKPHYGFDANAVERAMLQFVPFAKLCHPQRPTSAESRQRAVRLQELIHFCATEGLSKSEIDRAFKQFVFECMDLTSTDPNGFPLVKEKEGLQHTAIPWDDPYPFFKVMVPHVERPNSANIPISTPSEERSVVLAGKHSHHSTSSKGSHKEAHHHGAGTKFGGTGRGACTPDPLNSGKETVSRPDSGDSKKGILISSARHSQSSQSPRRSRSNSVHWDVSAGPEELEIDGEASIPKGVKSMDESLMEIVDAQQRNLDQWCFAEHFKPHILLQVLQEAAYHLPFVESYHHKRDQTLMLVLHNPHSMELQNHVDWHKELHSNAGFRNYLENTAESIAEWLKEKEAEYQAKILSHEVESITKEEEEKAKAAEKAEGKGKKSPRKSPSRSKSPKGSRGSSAERVSSSGSNPYVRAGSLKAWQAEQDKLLAEEEEKEKAKVEKRSRSAQKLREKEEKEKAEKSRSPKSSAKSRQSKVASELDPAALQMRQSQAGGEMESFGMPEPEKFWPFSGYDTGNHLIHVSGITTTLFPSDGGRIKTERTEFVQGTTAIRSVIQKDEHVFAIHILNPREDMNLPEDYIAQLEAQGGQSKRESFNVEKSEIEKSEKEESGRISETLDEADENKDEESELLAETRRPAVSQFGSITAQLSDGMILALSQFGPTGESYLKPYEPRVYMPAPSESPSVMQAAVSPSKSRKEMTKAGAKSTPEPDKKKGQATPDLDKSPAVGDEDIFEEEKKDEEKPIANQEFQELFVTCPDGLTVKYFLQSSIGVIPSSPEERQLAVKQSYPFKTKGVQDCEGSRRKYIQTEVSRVITADGNVVKNMVDGSVEVLSADGTVSVFTGTWPMNQSRASSPARSRKSLSGRDTPVKKSKGSAKGLRGKGGPPEVEPDEETKSSASSPNWIITYPNGERLQIFKDSGNCNELKSVPVCLASDPDTQQTMSTRDDHVITISYPDGTTVVEHADGTRITVYYRETAVLAEDTDDGASPQEVGTQTLKFVKVECPAFATVEFNTATSENLTVFGSGTSINVFPDGYYILHHSRGGRVEVDTEGTMVYFPRRSRFLEHLMPERELQYVLRHNADVIVETVDPDGNVFNVRSTGDFNVIPAQGDEVLSEDSDDQTGGKDKSKITTYGQHAPRFFIIHADGSGTELLRYQDVAEYLMMAEQNPATAVLKDALPEHPGVSGVTILKPYLSGLSEKWLKKYDQESIVPHGIRCRDLANLPSKEQKKPGPKFGTNVGQGLNIGSSNKGPVRIPILKCPNKLELRQIVQYKPVSEQLRNKLQGGLREYAEAVVARMRAESLMGVDDPRSEDEKILAQDLKILADSQKSQTKECEPEHVKSIYEKAVAPPQASPPPTPAPKRTQADWERDRREMEEETDAKRKIKNKQIEPYFDSELGKAFLLTQASDMDEMMRQLAEDNRQGNALDAPDPVTGGANSRLTYTQSPAFTQNVPPSQPGASVLSDRSTTSDSPGNNLNIKNGQETPLSFTGGMSEAATVTPSGGVRPHNPTPAHATGQGSPAPLRPKNPTPAHAGKVQTDRPDMEVKSADRELMQIRALKTNVLGEPRSESVPLPLSIMGGRPGAQPNIRFKETEEPVRRQVKTSLVAGATPKGHRNLTQMRGLICQPEGVNFGVLKEGCTYAYNVTLKNTGVDTCRFKVRQPPPATGLRAVYKPGPVAAGMSVDLSLELYAIANGVEGESGVGSLGHVLEIVTETDILEVPIVATILTAHEYDNPAVAPAGLRETSARLISTRPPASTGIIRPRRDQRMPVAS